MSKIWPWFVLHGGYEKGSRAELNKECVGEEDVPEEDHPHVHMHLFTVAYMWGKRSKDA